MSENNIVRILGVTCSPLYSSPTRETTMSKKMLSEKELIKGIAPDTAHTDELATVSWNELGLEPSESDYKAVLKRIESLFDLAEPSTPEGN